MTTVTVLMTYSTQLRNSLKDYKSSFNVRNSCIEQYGTFRHLCNGSSNLSFSRDQEHKDFNTSTERTLLETLKRRAAIYGNSSYPFC